MLRHMPPTSDPPATAGERPVKLFRNGRNQAVRIPREFELPGEDAIMRKEGDKLVTRDLSGQGGPQSQMRLRMF